MCLAASKSNRSSFSSLLEEADTTHNNNKTPARRATTSLSSSMNSKFKMKKTNNDDIIRCHRHHCRPTNKSTEQRGSVVSTSSSSSSFGFNTPCPTHHQLPLLPSLSSPPPCLALKKKAEGGDGCWWENTLLKPKTFNPNKFFQNEKIFIPILQDSDDDDECLNIGMKENVPLPNNIRILKPRPFRHQMNTTVMITP